MFRFIQLGLALMLQRFPFGQYDTIYANQDTDDAGLATLTKLKLENLAVGLTYYVAEPVGTDVGNKRRYVLRARTITAGNFQIDILRAQNAIARGDGYTANNAPIPASASRPEGSVAHTPTEQGTATAIQGADAKMQADGIYSPSTQAPTDPAPAGKRRACLDSGSKVGEGPQEIATAAGTADRDFSKGLSDSYGHPYGVEGKQEDQNAQHPPKEPGVEGEQPRIPKGLGVTDKGVQGSEEIPREGIPGGPAANAPTGSFTNEAEIPGIEESKLAEDQARAASEAGKAASEQMPKPGIVDTEEVAAPRKKAAKKAEDE